MNRVNLILDIINNPGKHQVDRNKKMSDSIDVAESNIRKLRKLKANSDLIGDSVNRGYGQGRKMGD